VQPRLWRPSTTSIVAQGSDESGDGDVGFYANVKKNVQIICRGSSAIFSDMKKAANIKKLKKLKGLPALSFTQYQFLQQTKGDITKCFRLLITIPLSPEFFFYSYIVFPLFSSSNPWAWRSLPSGFDDPRDVAVRETAINKRRQQTVVFGLHALQAETIDDVGTLELRREKINVLNTIEKVLKTNTLSSGLELIKPWLLSDVNSSKKLGIKKVPGSVVKQCCRSFGEEGVPNIPLIRRLNIGQVNTQINNIRESDNFLDLRGVKTLTNEEAKAACYERCISTEKKTAPQMRSDLTEWLDEVKKPVALPTSVSTGKGKATVMVTNYQNKRLAMMALHTVKGLKSSDFCAVYRAATI